MSQNFDVNQLFEGLSDDEANELTQHIVNSAQGGRQSILAKRDNTKMAQLRADYEAELAQLRRVPYPISHEAGVRKLVALKAKYRRLGLEVW